VPRRNPPHADRFPPTRTEADASSEGTIHATRRGSTRRCVVQLCGVSTDDTGDDHAEGASRRPCRFRAYDARARSRRPRPWAPSSLLLTARRRHVRPPPAERAHTRRAFPRPARRLAALTPSTALPHPPIRDRRDRSRRCYRGRMGALRRAAGVTIDGRRCERARLEARLPAVSASGTQVEGAWRCRSLEDNASIRETACEAIEHPRDGPGDAVRGGPCTHRSGRVSATARVATDPGSEWLPSRAVPGQETRVLDGRR
jgi:hypothetical protein